MPAIFLSPTQISFGHLIDGAIPTPSSAWFVDYTLFERIHYLLVANYDVFGPVAHNLSTRLYFDLLRYEGESNFMRLLPPEKRHELFKGLYQGISSRELRKKGVDLLNENKSKKIYSC